MFLISNVNSLECYLHDFKVIKVKESKIGLLKTKVVIAVRYTTTDSHSFRFKHLFIILLQIEYLTKRIKYLNSILEHIIQI